MNVALNPAVETELTLRFHIAGDRQLLSEGQVPRCRSLSLSRMRRICRQLGLSSSCY